MERARNVTQQKMVHASKPDFSNLESCILDSKRAALMSDYGPDDPTDYSELRRRLEASKEKLPPLYRENVFKPYTEKLDWLGKVGFEYILRDDPAKEGIAGLTLDIAHAILQNGEGYQEYATDAFQEVCSDLYDGFLSAEDRRGVKPPDLSVIPPLVKWGRPDFGPYTWTIEPTSVFGLKAAIVNLPPANARYGLLAWATLSHETAGHDILHADKGLIGELANSVREALAKENINEVLPDYWANRIDETASDTLGILNMGPTVGISLIGYFRALNAAWGAGPMLRNIGPWDDEHPADIVRGYLAASVIRQLSFDGRDVWGKAIEAETDKDLKKILLEDVNVDPDDVKKSTDIVAKILVRKKMNSLENHALGEIQDWHNRDEWIVNTLRGRLNIAGKLPKHYTRGIYAAHVVAAAVAEALAPDADIPLIFDRMQGMLKTMHDGNPSWGPLYVEHPGDLVSLRTYIPIEQ